MPVIYPNPCNPCNPCGGAHECDLENCTFASYYENKCTHCVGNSMRGPQTWRLEVPDLDCCPGLGGQYDLTFLGNCFYRSPVFICDGVSYIWELNLFTVLQLVQPGNPSAVLLTYKVPLSADWFCECENFVTLDPFNSNCPGVEIEAPFLCLRPEETCSGCANGFERCFEMVVAGIVGNGEGCDDTCPDYNGVFELKFERERRFGDLVFCIWRTEVNTPCVVGSGFPSRPAYELFMDDQGQRAADLFLRIEDHGSPSIIMQWRFPPPGDDTLNTCVGTRVMVGASIEFICKDYPVEITLTPKTCEIYS